MQQLKQIINVNKIFQKSINLRLNYNQPEKMEGYIPTRASVAILKKYVKQMKDKGLRSSILIGPYGKGKSHLLLVLLALLTKENRTKHPQLLTELIDKIAKVDEETAKDMASILKKDKYYLPVLVSGTQNDLNRTFLLALKDGLEREGLLDIMPYTYFEEAIKKIHSWKEEYPLTYEQFLAQLNEEKMTEEQLRKGLELYEEASLKSFQKIYPKLTAGASFEPMVEMDLISLYKSVNEKICEEYGYSGIILIFDEFSKFVEGYPKERFSAAMEDLQNMCELANASKEQEMHIILVAHKAMKEYKNTLPKEVINAYTGVEGRLGEIYFTTSLKNSYELIQNVLQKDESAFKKVCELPVFKEMEQGSYQLPYFKNMFLEEEFSEIVAKGCYPFTPVTAYLLLKISETAVQNERTVFTFLANDEKHSLPYYLEHCKKDTCFVTAGQIYDYFYNIFKNDKGDTAIHQEWLKAEYALSGEHTSEEQECIKTLALLLMVGKQDEMYARDEVLRIGCGFETEQYEQVMDSLKEKQIILFRSHTQTYAFKNHIGVDLDKEIEKCMQTKFTKIVLAEELQKYAELEYELPKRFNQEYMMTRYFKYQFISEENFFALKNSQYMFENDFSDGRILCILRGEEDQQSEIRKKTKELGDRRIVVLYPNHSFSMEKLLKKILAIRFLKQEKDFLEDNKALEKELCLYEEDLLFELNVGVEQDFMPMYGNCQIFYMEEQHDTLQMVEKKSNSKFNQFLSQIFATYYCCTPKINNELINKRQLTTQIKKARLKLIENILGEYDFSQYLKGTMAEATIFRAVFLRTGVIELQDGDDMLSYPWDRGVLQLLEEMDHFVESSVEKKQDFSLLYASLQGEKYGVRNGVLPLYLAFVMAFTHNKKDSREWKVRTQMPVLYLHEKEVELTPQLFENINANPENYGLRMEQESQEKDKYLHELEQLFDTEEKAALVNKKKRLLQISDQMYRWFCSLPQCSRNYGLQEHTEQEQKAYKIFRQSFSKIERNPRELLYEKIPNAFETQDYTKLVIDLKKMKQEMEQYSDQIKDKIVTVTRTVMGLEEKDDFLKALKNYCEAHTKGKEEYVQERQVKDFFSCILELSTHNEREIAEKLSKTVLDLFVEDWKEDTILKYESSLRDIQTQIEASADEEEDTMQKIVFTNSRGQEVVKHLRMEEEENGTSLYLQNEIESALEEFGDSMETNEKITVMVRMIEKLLEE